MNNMSSINNWKIYFESIGLTTHEIPGRDDSIQLTNLAGAPIFIAVKSKKELDDLHTKARAKSAEMRRLLLVGLPLNHPLTILTLPGDIVLPKFRVYAGHAADTFSINGHQIEPKLLKGIKKEVLHVIERGVSNSKTPLCSWIMKLLGKNWKYGTPSSLVQMDSMLALISQDVELLGHVRSRQLSFGRGCSDGIVLPTADYVMKNNSLDLRIPACDLKLFSMEQELENYSPARNRLYPLYSHLFLTALASINESKAKEIGCASLVGKSSIGKLPKTRKIATTLSQNPVETEDDTSVYA